jgi:hypothetical protein
MTGKKLNDRQQFLLWLVAKHTDRNWETGEVSRFFYPSAGAYYYRDNGKDCSTFVSGSDGIVLRGLQNRGLIEHPKSSLVSDTGTGRYVFQLTEDGLQAVEQHELNSRFQ